MITHDTPAALDARPNSLKISKIGFFFKEVLGASAEVRPSSETPQMHGQGKCQR
jgi:hypothetical protein